MNVTRNMIAPRSSRRIGRALRWVRYRSVVESVLISATATGLAFAQPPQAVRRLSLDDALRIAVTQSEAVGVARAGQDRASGQLLQARSQLLPQLYGNAGYTKTLKSQFSGISFGGGDDSGPSQTPALCSPHIRQGATDAERLAALSMAISCSEASSGDGGGGFDFSSTGFGARNQWLLGLQFSQHVFSGGRVRGQIEAAGAQERSATIEVGAQRAQAALDVTQAYFDATLADQLVGIADSSLAQAEELLRQATRGREIGTMSEFDLLRARVTRDNQRPILIQATSNRDIAYYRLKQLLELPLDSRVELTTGLPDDADLSAIATSELVRGSETPDTSVANRAPVRQMAEAVRAQEAMVAIARSERLPTLSITSGYQRLYFPNSTFPDLGQARQNWTIGLSSNFTLFSGGRVRGEELIARANLDEARRRLSQSEDLAELDGRIALSQLEQAEASWRASQGTVEQAQRAYAIDEVRFREGVSTQTDLAQSRLLVEQATANRAMAARDLAVARMRIRLLRDLPLQMGGQPGMPRQDPMPQQTPNPQTAPSATGATGVPPGA